MVERRKALHQKHSKNRVVVKLELLTCDVLFKITSYNNITQFSLFFFNFLFRLIINRTHDPLIFLYMSKP